MPFRARNPNGKPLGAEPNAAAVKRRALELGADLAGIASAATLNAFPPDPRWPQTPERILPSIKSVIVLVQRIPAGAFRAVSNVPVQYMDMLVLRKMDKIAYRLAEELERVGHPTFVTAAQETDWSLKRASYGRLSTRHLGVEAVNDLERAGRHTHSRGGAEVFARQALHSLVERMGGDDDVMLRRSEYHCGKGNEESDERQAFH